jgi:hypothetical protein
MEVREPVVVLGVSMAGGEKIGEEKAAPLGYGGEFFEPLQTAKDATSLVAFEFRSNAAVVVSYDEGGVFHGLFHEHVVHPAVIQHVDGLLPAGKLIERWLCNVDMATTDEFGHLPEEEGQQQRADVRTIHIGIGHDDDPAVSQFADVEIFADPALQGLDEGSDFLEAEDLVEPCLLDVEEFATEREDCLIDVIPASLGASTRGVTFDEEDFGLVDLVT